MRAIEGRVRALERRRGPRWTVDLESATAEQLRLAQTFVADSPADRLAKDDEVRRRLAAATDHELRVLASMRIVFEPVRAADAARADRQQLQERAGPSA